MTSISPPLKPAILCLHGGGTSALIFKIQLRRVSWALHEHFRFIFVDAPFLSAAGPNVLPVFADCGPYYSWVAPKDQDQAQAQKKVREVIRKVIQENGGHFVGLLGFSQGTRLVAGLLADQQEGTSVGMPEWKFGLCICGSYPPLSLSVSKRPPGQAEGAASEGKMWEPSEEIVIDLPSVHVRGLLDKNLFRGRSLAKYFSPQKRVEMEFQMGHNLPGAADDKTSEEGATQRIADAVLATYSEAQRIRSSEGNTHSLKDSRPDVMAS